MPDSSGFTVIQGSNVFLLFLWPWMIKGHKGESNNLLHLKENDIFKKWYLFLQKIESLSSLLLPSAALVSALQYVRPPMTWKNFVKVNPTHFRNDHRRDKRSWISHWCIQAKSAKSKEIKHSAVPRKLTMRDESDQWTGGERKKWLVGDNLLRERAIKS